MKPPQPPLDGIMVLDLSRALAAPFCTMMLADLGATVLKVEQPGTGDQSRAWGPEIGEGERTYFFAANRSKQSIAIDIAKPEGAALVRRLAAGSDVLVENFLSRSLPKYGLGPVEMTQAYPRLIYCSLSGYGRTGAMADRPGYDTVLQAESGIMSITGPIDGAPAKAGMPISDTVAGMYCAQAILAALLARARDGVGQIIDISMLDCSVAALTSVAANALLLGRPAGRFGNGHADIVPQDLYQARDGAFILHIGTDAQFRRFCCEVLEDPALAQDPRLATNGARVAHRAVLDDILAAAFAKRALADWIARLSAAEIAAGVVRDVLEATRAPELRDRGMIRTVRDAAGHGRDLVGSPLRFGTLGGADPAYPPRLGEHTDAILADRLGMTAAEIEALRAAGVVA